MVSGNGDVMGSGICTTCHRRIKQVLENNVDGPVWVHDNGSRHCQTSVANPMPEVLTGQVPVTKIEQSAPDKEQP